MISVVEDPFPNVTHVPNRTGEPKCPKFFTSKVPYWPIEYLDKQYTW